MFSLNQEKYINVKSRVERLYRRYCRYDVLTNGQIVSKILVDLDSHFLDDYEFEIATYICLAQINEDNVEILNYLQGEYKLLISDLNIEQVQEDDWLKYGIDLLTKKPLKVV